MNAAHPAVTGLPRTRASDVIDVAVVGGGAAGLAAAIFSARAIPNARISVLDGARRIGAKILVSGGGRCNVTNRDVRAGDFWGGDRRFVAAVLGAFPAAGTIRFFEQLGVPLHEEENGKMFPDSNRSRTVLEALLGEARRLGVVIRPDRRVETVRAGGGGFILRTGSEQVAARRVVLATGGLSLPKTGSDGGGLRIAAGFGHTIVPTTPALAALVLGGSFHVALAGISHEAAILVRAERTTPVRLRGPLLWTHFGASGPVALDASRHWHRASLQGGPVTARLSFLPDLDFAGAEAFLLGAAGARPTGSVRAALSESLPEAVAGALLDAAGVDPNTRLAHLSRDDRRRIGHALVDWDLPITGSRGYNYAEATAGGVALDEIDRRTMESRKCPGVHMVGEMLDVDGRLGGFNFQWAWSSAWVAARGLAQSITGEHRDG